ncbi:MAG TPA: SPOR domain-containing protein [Burkholderiaceae bacterium]|nr:SPOR domain-containing protein [Burkholderiaceae bacterium]
MSLAFWRRKNTAPDASELRSTRTAASDDDSGARTDPTAVLRARARRRLIGAAALLLLVVIVVPMVLDPEPKPVPDNIPIDIPSEKTKFSPRLALPPVPAQESVSVAPPPDAAPTKAAPPAPAAAPTAATPPPGAEPAKDKPAKSVEASKAEERRAREVLDGKAGTEKSPVPVKGGKFAVQAAATSSEAAALELSERLKKAGLPPYTERIDTAEGARYRVRVGPYANREEAERVRGRLKALGINANIVSS